WRLTSSRRRLIGLRNLYAGSRVRSLARARQSKRPQAFQVPPRQKLRAPCADGGAFLLAVAFSEPLMPERRLPPGLSRSGLPTLSISDRRTSAQRRPQCLRVDLSG